MGGAASIEGQIPEMSDEAKIQLVARMKNIYEEKKVDGVMDDLAIFDEMKKAYETIVKEVLPQDVPSAEKKKKVRRPSAVGGVEAANLSEEEDIAAAAARAAAAQIEMPSPKNKKDFRKRRLTLTTRRPKGSKGDQSNPHDTASKNGNAATEGNRGNGVSPVRTRRQSLTRTFQSHEIGDVPDIPQPFPLDSVGTYSCHGIEPSWDDDGYTAKINQDRGTVCHPYANSDITAFFAVFDGHGEKGDKVSHFVMREIQKQLEAHTSLSTDPATALKETFVTVNRQIGEKNIECMYSGTTAVAVYMHSGTMWAANAGDSRAVMAKNQSGKLVAENLTIDHNPDMPTEKARILASGGFVSPPPEPGLSARVWLDKEMTQIGLAMARSIGDHAVKHIGVIAEPEVFQRDISPDDRFMILASDGVWEFIESQEAVNIVATYLGNGATAACQKLIETAAERWRYNEGDYRDDITAIVAKIPCVEVVNPQSVPG